jgi:tRNA pseudouridine32 synthase/23S rRNA pseudouridine746 synthase
MAKGAVWLRRTRRTGRAKTLRLRRASSTLSAGDHIEMYYDADILAQSCPAADRRFDSEHYSVWYKPAGLLTQGTQFGDACSLLRQAEHVAGGGRQMYLVHRLDREAQGLVLVAHSSRAAATLSRLFQDNTVDKSYRVQVLGHPSEHGCIDTPLDGKVAQTKYWLRAHDAVTDVATLDVVIRSGRLHQIRRHLAGIGHPIMGDPRYGEGNKNTAGMRLIASALSFECPFAGRSRHFALEAHELAF